jgi:hypothetical protein
MTEDKVLSRIDTADNNRQTCKMCERTIPADVKRLSIHYKNGQWSATLRICGLCLRKAGNHVNDEALEKWAQNIFLTEKEA